MNTHRSFRSAAFALPLLALVSFGAVACKDPSEGKTQATVGEAKPVPSVAQNAASGGAANKVETVAFDEKAGSVGFVGAKVTGSHEGKLEKLAGSITLVEGKAAGSQVKVSLDNTSIAIEPDMLKKHLLGADFFDAEKFPKTSFESTEVKASASGGDKFDVTGNLDLHGTKKSISFPATIKVEAGTVAISAEFAINRKDFGINYAGKANDLIRDNVTIKIDLKAPRKG